MIKMQYGASRPESSVSWYRSTGVLPKIHKLNPNIQVELAGQISWTYLSDTDILYLESPADKNMLLASTIAKNYGIKLWIDYDDNLLNIPMSHPRYKTLTDFYTKECIAKC